ncbi:hypothetical protein Hanom_Chr10g00955321 [Helianthus anomalus]
MFDLILYVLYKVFDPELIKDASAAGDDELLNTSRLALQCVHPSPQDRSAGSSAVGRDKTRNHHKFCRRWWRRTFIKLGRLGIMLLLFLN